MTDEEKHWVGFSVFPGIGPVRFKLLLEYFGTAKKAWEAPRESFREIRLGDRLTDEFIRFRESFSLDRYVRDLQRLGVSVLTSEDVRYPSLLRAISDPPYILYIKGKKGDGEWDIGRSIAVVGTRKMTAYGKEVTERLVTDLTAYGCTIVSGMAYGIDAAAHARAIECSGKTIAVLGCGIDVIAPASNSSLYHAITEGGHGAVVSEMPLGLRPQKGLFISRNRIISGLSLGTVVIEGAEDSGALITAGYALEQGREVFAVPGPITSPYSRASAKLLKNGAKLVESAQDIIEELGFDIRRQKNSVPRSGRPDASPEEKKILDVVSDRRVHIDEIVRRTGLTTSVVAATLTVLEMNGEVRDYGENTYEIL